MLKLNYSKSKLECGLDEAGRGALAGPVVAAAVILPKNFTSDLINDSKKLSPKNRFKLKEQIEKEALYYSIGFVDHKRIEQVNILNASIEAMHLSISKLTITPEFLLIDGNKFKTYQKIPHKCIVKGDSKYLNIAAASILAKTYRDIHMTELHNQYPQYHWDKNKGYPTKKHRDAIKKFGPCHYHRKTFQLLDKQLSLF